MGLDITAYKNLKALDEKPVYDEYTGHLVDGYETKIDEEYGYLIYYATKWHPGAGMEWAEECFPGRGEGIDPQLVYVWEDKYEFRAGSYGGYGEWRKILKEFARGNDFQELINFADNEGVIGPIVAKKLYNDFERNLNNAQEYAFNHHEVGKWWFEKYKDWLIACLFASENGAIDFH